MRRLERGIAYHLVSARDFTDAEWSAIAGVLHDRMTESVLHETAAAVQAIAEALSALRNA